MILLDQKPSCCFGRGHTYDTGPKFPARHLHAGSDRLSGHEENQFYFPFEPIATDTWLSAVKSETRDRTVVVHTGQSIDINFRRIAQIDKLLCTSRHSNPPAFLIAAASCCKFHAGVSLNFAELSSELVARHCDACDSLLRITRAHGAPNFADCAFELCAQQFQENLVGATSEGAP